MRQQTFAQYEYSQQTRVTQKRRFFRDLEQLVPWSALLAQIESVLVQAPVGRRPYPIALMLRAHIAQHCLGLSDEAIEDALYENMTVRNFVGIDGSDQGVPDATTLLRFRHALEAAELHKTLFDTINQYLKQHGFSLSTGNVMDATLIASTSSTKNQSGKRDPQMHQTKKGNQYYHGCKMHIGVDAEDGLIHSMELTAANVHDITQAHKLIRDTDEEVFGDAGYTGLMKRTEMQHRSDLIDHIAMRLGKRRQLDKSTEYGQIAEAYEKKKASIRAKVEHAFHTIKNIFGFKKTRYRGLAKNRAVLYVLCGVTNLMRARKRLLYAG